MKQYTGLTAQQVKISREQNGANSLPAAKNIPAWRILLAQFVSPLILILLLAAAFTLLLRDYIEFMVIVIIVLVNTLLGYFQEVRAQRALEALKRIIKPQVSVIREGKQQTIDSEQIVVGDLLRLKLGDRVPADGVVLEAAGFSVNESVLTGEAAPVEKTAQASKVNEAGSARSEVYMGTVVLSGFAIVEVKAVGLTTQFGKIAQTLSSADDSKTPLQKRLNKFSQQIALVVIGLAIVVFGLGYFLGNSAGYTKTHTSSTVLGGSEELVGLISLCISLAVSAIPEGLAISLTVVLTLSMQRLLKRQALVRKLVVAETLGSVSTICVDKTGTLTEGKMVVIATDFTSQTAAIETLVAVTRDLNAVDQAVGNWLAEQSLTNSKLELATPVLFDLPFDSTNKFAASVHEDKIYVVGAPEVLIKQAKLNSSTRREWQIKLHKQAEQGHRVIGIGVKANPGVSELPALKQEQQNLILAELEWLGSLIIEDPIRSDVKQALAQFTTAGIKLKVITGDQRPTAIGIMKHAGIAVQDKELLSGQELETIDDRELQARLPEIKLFYRTAPEQKLRIVELLKQQGEVVAMMGDGINDAPALKRADVGIAVANATEVSKETADIVLLDNNIRTIVAAVEEGRTIFNNLRKIITYLLSDSTAEVILIIGSLVLGLPLPLLPLQILYINLVADGLPDLALAFEPAEKDLLKDPPRPLRAGLLDREMLTLIGIIGLVVNSVIFVIYVLLLETGADIERIRSFIFLLLAADSLLYVYSIRSLRHSIWQSNPLANRTLNTAVIIGAMLVAASFLLPFIREAMDLVALSWAEVAVVPVLGVIKIIIIELIKALYLRRLGRQGKRQRSK